MNSRYIGRIRPIKINRTVLVSIFETICKALIVSILVLSFPLFSGERENIDKTFQLLKSGYEKKDTALLSQCFLKMSDKQLKAYQDIFKATKDYSVSVNVTNVQFNGSSNIARVDALLSFKYKVFIDKYSEDKETSKPVSYLLYKSGARWCIMGTHEASKGVAPVTDQNYEEINEALKKLPVEVRQKLFTQISSISLKRPKMQWAAVPGADFYVISITKDDVTKVKETTQYWKMEKYRLPSIDIPATILSNLTIGNNYFCNVFAYTPKEESISGVIIKFTYVSE